MNIVIESWFSIWIEYRAYWKGPEICSHFAVKARLKRTKLSNIWIAVNSCHSYVLSWKFLLKSFFFARETFFIFFSFFSDGHYFQNLLIQRTTTRTKTTKWFLRPRLLLGFHATLGFLLIWMVVFLWMDLGPLILDWAVKSVNIKNRNSFQITMIFALYKS